jgi:hypothetical protein
MHTPLRIERITFASLEKQGQAVTSSNTMSHSMVSCSELFDDILKLFDMRTMTELTCHMW